MVIWYDFGISMMALHGAALTDKFFGIMECEFNTLRDELFKSSSQYMTCQLFHATNAYYNTREQLLVILNIDTQ